MRRRFAVGVGAAALVLCVAIWVWADADSDYEEAAGVDKALGATPPTMTADADLEGKSFTEPKGFGKDGCPVTFKFDKAKKGEYPYRAAGGKVVAGVYIKVSASYDGAKCREECSQVKVLQVYRDFTKDAAGAKQTADPGSAERRARAGWGDPAAKSRGWGVDTASTDPHYGPGAAKGSAETGSTTTPSVERDAPGNWKEARNKGSEFVTCAVCANAGAKSKIIACYRWGFYQDGTGNVSFEPKPPTTSSTAPQEVKDALERFESIPGNSSANVGF